MGSLKGTGAWREEQCSRRGQKQEQPQRGVTATPVWASFVIWVVINGDQQLNELADVWSTCYLCHSCYLQPRGGTSLTQRKQRSSPGLHQIGAKIGIGWNREKKKIKKLFLQKWKFSALQSKNLLGFCWEFQPVCGNTSIFSIPPKYPRAFLHRQIIARPPSSPPAHMHSFHLLCIHPEGEHFLPSQPWWWPPHNR